MRDRTGCWSRRHGPALDRPAGRRLHARPRSDVPLASVRREHPGQCHERGAHFRSGRGAVGVGRGHHPAPVRRGPLAPVVGDGAHRCHGPRGRASPAPVGAGASRPVKGVTASRTVDLTGVVPGSLRRPVPGHRRYRAGTPRRRVAEAMDLAHRPPMVAAARARRRAALDGPVQGVDEHTLPMDRWSRIPGVPTAGLGDTGAGVPVPMSRRAHSNGTASLRSPQPVKAEGSAVHIVVHAGSEC